LAGEYVGVAYRVGSRQVPRAALAEVLDLHERQGAEARSLLRWPCVLVGSGSERRGWSANGAWPVGLAGLGDWIGAGRLSVLWPAAACGDRLGSAGDAARLADRVGFCKIKIGGPNWEFFFQTSRIFIRSAPPCQIIKTIDRSD